MYIPRLDEFTTEQLQVLLNVVVTKIVDEEKTRKQYLNFATTCEKREYDTLCLWRVQILNSLDKIRKQEQVNNN